MDKIFIEENKHLQKVKSGISKKMADLEKSLETIGATNLSRLKELRQEGEFGPDFVMYLEQLHEKNEAFNLKDKFKRIEEFKFLETQPFFSRIDLQEGKKKANQIYIGKFGFTEDDASVAVTDWRAKIASVYYRYRYPQKDVYYETPAGVEKRDLLLKRTFEIAEGELVKYYNNDLQLDENSVLADKIGKKTGGVLEDIVETIQQSQMDIIESDPRQVCIVQGCVGSGKSTVAIHKLAHIFFNYPNLIHSNKSIVVAKNQILVGYLSTLFPKLGIFDINYKTVREILINLIFREQIPIKANLDDPGDPNHLQLDKIEKLYEELNKIHKKYEEKLNELFNIDEFEPFGGYKYSPSLSPSENVQDIMTELEEEIVNQKDELKDLSSDSIKAYLCRENIKSLRKLVGKLSDMLDSIKNTDTSSVAKVFGINTKEKLNYSQSILYAYTYLSLIGIRKHPVYEYCVVDEGQDFSPIEYALLSKVVLRGRFAIFGDLNQALEPGGIKKWEDLFYIIKEAKSSARYELNTNYRSTSQIIKYAIDILRPYTKEFIPESIDRQGPEPEIIYFKDNNTLISKLEENIEKDADEMNKSIGVICFDEKLQEKVVTNIKKIVKNEDALIVLDQATRVNYIPKGVYIMNPLNSKGLEFSKVYIVGLNLKNISNFAEARKAFVTTTRAMNELVIYGIGENEKSN